MKWVFLTLVAACGLLTISATDDPMGPQEPFTEPGVILPGLSVPLLVFAAGGVWTQPRLIDSYAYVCSDVLPTLAYNIPEVEQIRPYYEPVCDDVIEAISDVDGFDATEFCYTLVNLTNMMVPGPVPTMPPNEQPGDVGAANLTMGEQLLQTLLETTSNYFEVDVANPLSICDQADRFLIPSLPDLLTDFSSELLSVLLPYASPMCEDFEGFLADTLGLTPDHPYIPLMLRAADLGGQLLGFDDREGACTAILDAIANPGEDNAQAKAVARDMIESVLGILTDVDRCETITTDVIHEVVEPIIAPDGSFNISDALINQYTGFYGVGGVCRALDTASTGCSSGFAFDACGVCVFRGDSEASPLLSSASRDCAELCPLQMGYGQEINECGFCTLDMTEGMNECGECEASSLDCLGCDGIPNSGMIYDACDVCGGDGSTCTDISALNPTVIPADTDYEIMLQGAGFDTTPPPTCRFTNQANPDTTLEVTLDVSSHSSGSCTVNLPSGSYQLVLDIPEAEFDAISPDLLVVYAPITIDREQTVEFELDSTIPGQQATFSFPAEEGSDFSLVSSLTPYLIFHDLPFPAQMGVFSEDLQEMRFTLVVPPQSALLDVSPSLNGIDPLPTTLADGKLFGIIFRSDPPRLVEGTPEFYPTGLLHLDFERPIMLAGVDNPQDFDCNEVFNVSVAEGETARTLGESARCSLTRDERTVIFTLGGEDNLVIPGDMLIVLPYIVLTSFSIEEYPSALEVELSLPISAGDPPSVGVVLGGAAEFSSCGNLEVHARESTGGAGRALSFQWSVMAEGVADDDLAALRDALGAVTTADLSVDGTLMLADQEYTISVTAMNFLGGEGTDSIMVMRSSEATPDVEITPRGVDPESVRLSQSFYLDADVTFYSDCEGGEPDVLQFIWSVATDDVTLDETTAMSRSLYVPAYSLPADTMVTFSVEVRRGMDDAGPSYDISVMTESSDVEAMISGGSERDVGVDSGIVELDGSMSYDPDAADRTALTYQWTCIQITDSAQCISNLDGSFFPQSAALGSSRLSFDASHMTPGKEYRFTLTVSRGSSNDEESVVITALPGNPPMVTVSRLHDGPVLAGEPLTLTAIVQHTSPVTINWDIAGKNTVLDLQNVDLNPANIMLESSTISLVTVEKDTLMAGESYVVEVNVVDESMQNSSSQFELEVSSGVTSCELALDKGDSYTELDVITFLVDNCVTDEGAFPLTYQLFWYNENFDQRELTIASQNSRPSIVGPAAARDGINVFRIEVCNQYGSCMFNVIAAGVNATENFDYNVIKMILVDEEVLKGDFIKALRNLNTLIQVEAGQANDVRRRRRAAEDTSQQAADQLLLLHNAVNTTVLDASAARILLAESEYIAVANLAQDDLDKFLYILHALMAPFTNSQEPIGEGSISIIKTVIDQIEEATDDEDTIDMLNKLAVSLARLELVGRPLGEDAITTITEDIGTTTSYNIPVGTFSSQVFSISSIINVDLGQEIAEMYGASWPCGSGASCVGVNIQYTHYADDVDPYSISSEDRENRASPVFDISLYDPSTWEMLEVGNLSDKVQINMPIVHAKEDHTYTCFFWDEEAEAWSTTGVDTGEVEGGRVVCSTSHLSSFVVLAEEEEEPIDKDGGNRTVVIIVSVLGALLALVIIFAIAIFILKKKGSEVDSTTRSDKGAALPTKQGDGSQQTSEYAYDFNMKNIDSNPNV